MPASEWAKLATAISRLAETIFATRESAYNRKLDKRQVKAIEWGERIALKVQELNIEDKDLKKSIRYFFKYNQ